MIVTITFPILWTWIQEENSDDPGSQAETSHIIA
jgi:hypothetical protein